MIPILAALLQAGLPILAGAIQTKGKDFIQEKLGVDITDMLGTEEGKLKLRQLEIQHEEWLGDQIKELRKLDMQEAGLYIADSNSAREREAKIATSEFAPWVNKVATPILAGGVLILTFVLFYALVFGDRSVEDGRKDVILYILGVLSSICSQIISYYFGSSKSSATKDETINVMQKAIK
jgi:hypothetical protein